MAGNVTHYVVHLMKDFVKPKKFKKAKGTIKLNV